MGAIANAMVSYAQPLIDKTNGSLEQVQKAFAIGQACWNMALYPSDEREQFITDMQATLQMDDGEFEEFRRSIILPMIRRHEEMFPLLHHRDSNRPVSAPSKAPSVRPTYVTQPTSTQARTGIGRNSPCPCNSGRKHKQCCGR